MLLMEMRRIMKKLIALVIEKVKENSGVTLEPEVRIIGEK